MEKTDKKHGLSLPMIQDELKKYGISVNRQALYDDFRALGEFGVDVVKTGSGPKTRYHIMNSEFELAEIKLLIDAVCASKFLTTKKTEELISKLSKVTSNYDEALLKRQVFVSGRIKNMNDSIFETIDVLHRAINLDRRVMFQYFSWNIQKEEELRHDGAVYEVSPWALFWDSDKYYLVAYDFTTREIKHYRVDKMINVNITEKKRKGVTAFEKINKSTYTQKHFGMFGGEAMSVTLECTNNMANVIVDRFGRKIDIIPKDDEHFTVDVDVIMSDKFLAWIIGIGKGVKVIGPKAAVDRMKEIKDRLCEEY